MKHGGFAVSNRRGRILCDDCRQPKRGLSYWNDARVTLDKEMPARLCTPCWEMRDAVSRQFDNANDEVRRRLRLRGSPQHPRPAPPTWSPMRDYVKLYRDEESVAINTNITDEEDFIRHAASALGAFLDENMMGDGSTFRSAKGETHDYLAAGLPQIIDIACKLRGYKAPLVDEQRVLIAGKIAPVEALIAAQSSQAENGIRPRYASEVVRADDMGTTTGAEFA
jgi:hypothetical protein